MIIQNGYVYGEDKKFQKRNLYIENGMIVSDESQIHDDTVIDATGRFVLPGLIDIHSHGACGYDFSDANEKGLRAILRYERSQGITSYCPTSMTLPKETLCRIFQTAKKIKDGYRCHEEADVVGINMEGPFLDKEKKGAHKEEYIKEPDIELFRYVNQKCDNLIRLVTVTPNSESAIEFIRVLHSEVVISLGHTNADYETCKRAIELGVHHITHLFNAMAPLNHRNPGLIGAAIEDDNCMTELICDGVHIHESLIKTAFKIFPERIVLISDSMRATGLKDGTYELGDQLVNVSGKLATLADGTIAGSVTNLFDCMRMAISYGIKPEIAIAAATINPAKSIGIFDKVGSITVGKKADILVVNNKWELLQVI